MRVYALVPLLAAIGHALPQPCQTTTEQVIIPTSTATYLSTHVTTVTATTAQDLGTFTDITRVSSTKTLETLTATATGCTQEASQSTATVYTTSGASSPSAYKYARGIAARQDAECTITKTSTTTYGQTYTFVPASGTSTYTYYTAYTQATVTSISSGFTAYAIATATASGCPAALATTTQDARCAPSALISAAGVREDTTQYGLSYAQLTSAGATYSTNTTNASSCCQICADAEKCAASSWDSRTGACMLAFPVQYDTGDLNCGLGLQVYYGAGPNHPTEPGSGLYVAEMCGNVAFANAKPDDGT